jgi:hypothetical protein
MVWYKLIPHVYFNQVYHTGGTPARTINLPFRFQAIFRSKKNKETEDFNYLGI